MRRAMSTLLVVFLLTFGLFAQGYEDAERATEQGVTLGSEGTHEEADTREALIDLTGIDGSFIENLGQLGEGAGLFYCRGDSLSVAFGTGWIAYNFMESRDSRGVLFRLEFVDANRVEPIGVEPLPHRSNYFKGNDPTQWDIGVRSFRMVLYQELWDDIDLMFYFRDGG